MHGRNLDFFMTEQLEMIFYEVTYIKDGEVSYKSIEAVGMSGATTIMKPHAFSVS
jgi:hypothetical protein